MNTNISKNKSLLNFVLLLFGLSIPPLVIGAIYDVQLLPGFNLFQRLLAIPAVTAGARALSPSRHLMKRLTKSGGTK